MAGRSSAEREALARQNAAIMAVFERAGFDHIAPDIIQPADIFLERSGEDIRARTFVFSDPDGNELCLRPDLTVPACRYHLSHAGNTAAEARYCYLGTAFRFPDELLSPQEFNQAGIEWFGDRNPVEAEARVMKLAIAALEAAGLSKLKITMGDLGLFNALINSMEMPERWRRRLKHQFWRPTAFRALLERFAKPSAVKRTAISEHVDAIAGTDADEAVSARIAALGLPLVTDRSVSEIAARLSEKLADRSETPLAADMVRVIERYLAIEGSVTDVASELAKLPASPAFDGARRWFEERIAALEDQGLNPRRFHFSANFGRELEYYTGLVFQVEVEARNAPLVVGGGGRYNDLLQDLGATTRVPAVGCAIHTERVKAVLA
ncbi:ATP phosphoribosyltransferase regulatory subunit [Aestuariivirga sp.]|uniref:ATP phosphoribosyltransferase regulatory subunit n=1 Tax=Aestuariivirga sp. TaxID=2650926 RepID=UPI0039E6E71E